MREWVRPLLGRDKGWEIRKGVSDKAGKGLQESQEAVWWAWTTALQNRSVTRGTPVILRKGLQLDKLLQVHESCTASVHTPSHPALHPDLVEPVHTSWTHVPCMEKMLQREEDDWKEAQGTEGTWGQVEFTEGEQLSVHGHLSVAGATARGRSEVEEA